MVRVMKFYLIKRINQMNDKVLECQHCGSDNLHQSGVVWFARLEDASVDNTTAFATLKNDLYDSKSDPADMVMYLLPASKLKLTNPSDRRDGTHVLFMCELCDGITTLIIEQHKGSTYMRIDEISDDVFNTHKRAVLSIGK
jgi:hypothetical protein